MMAENRECAKCDAWTFGDGIQCDEHGEEAMQAAERRAFSRAANRNAFLTDPELPARIVQSLRRDASGKGFAYLDSAADLIEFFMEASGR
jgi:hypothetical protein